MFSRLDLRLVGRPEFSLGRFSRPLSCIAICWLVLSTIQGCLPLTEFSGTHAYETLDKTFSTLPIFIGCMLLIMLLSWFLYGRYYHFPN